MVKERCSVEAESRSAARDALQQRVFEGVVFSPGPGDGCDAVVGPGGPPARSPHGVRRTL